MKAELLVVKIKVKVIDKEKNQVKVCEKGWSRKSGQICEKGDNVNDDEFSYKRNEKRLLVFTMVN